jgi:hypothetical protein
MRYRLSVLNVVTGLYLIGLIIFTIINYPELSYAEGWGVVYMVGLAAFGIVILVVDVILQQIIRDRKNMNIGGTVIAIIAAWYLVFIN